MDVCKLKHMDPFPGSVYEPNFLVFICSCAQPEDPEAPSLKSCL